MKKHNYHQTKQIKDEEIKANMWNLTLRYNNIYLKCKKKHLKKNGDTLLVKTDDECYYGFHYFVNTLHFSQYNG